MPRFVVDRAFYHALRDLLVLTGEPDEDGVGPGDLIDLPTHLGGPGPVPVESVQFIDFAEGQRAPGVMIALHHIAEYPDFEPVTVEGEALEVTSAPDSA